MAGAEPELLPAWRGYYDAFVTSLERDSSAIDWCEPNYVYSNHIAEFFNTISNILFFVFPPILMWLFHYSYARPIGYSTCHLAWICLFVVGVMSAYYHATLSLFGQLLDEISILWVIVMVVALWTPREYFPHALKKSRRRWQIALFIATLIITWMSWLMPSINAILLMCWGIPTTYIMVIETKRTRCPRAYMLGIRCVILWFCAFSTWLTDRLHCNFWVSVGFPYMHALWHLLIALCSYQGCVLLCFYNASVEPGLNEHPDTSSSLNLWPSNEWKRCGVPYVVIEKIPEKKVFDKKENGVKPS